MCAISLGKEDEEFADTLRLAMALTSSVALLRAIRLRTIVIYLIASEFDPSELLIHPFRRSGTRENWEATRHHRWHPEHRQSRPVAQESVDSVREDQGRASPGTNREALCRHIASPTTGRPSPTATPSDPSNPDRTPATAPSATAMPIAQADDEEDLELNYEENDSAMEADTTQGEATETPYGLPVVGEEALVSAVTEAMYDRMNGHGHHMQGGLKPAMATFRGLSADLLVSFFEARPDMWHASKLKVVKRTGYFHTRVVAAKEDTDMELPTGYSVGPSDPKTGGYVFRWEALPGKSEADKLEQEALQTVRSERARELGECARKLRATEWRERMERE
eukprot:jgi/Tetstr1/465674/TSEL_010317.t1